MAEISRRIVITGVSRGLGRALVECWSNGPNSLIGCARSESAIRELREQHAGHRFDVADVSEDDSVRQWAESVLSDGVPDLLINNAALINRNAPLWEVPREEFDLLMDVNVKGVANVIRHFAPAMIARGQGVFVNISSGWGRAVSADVAPYCATKWAIEGLTRAFAKDLPEGMAAIPLDPGIIDTEMLQSCFGEQASGYRGPEPWAKVAGPMILGFGPEQNGQPLSVEG